MNDDMQGTDETGTMSKTEFGKSGKRFWKSMGELTGTPETQEWLDDEFPQRASMIGLDRRQFLSLGAAAAALAGASGCRYLPQQHAVPYVKAPEEMISGKSLEYASTIMRGGFGIGVLVESNEGRPTKIEGNPRHPASLGATDVWTQAEILNLYDPDRTQVVSYRGEISVWDALTDAIRKPMRAQEAKQGSGIRILTETVTSPTLYAQIQRLLKKYPNAKWHQYEPINRDNILEGTQIAFGKPLNPVYKLKNADVILSLDADFLLTEIGSVRFAREYADGRRVRNATKTMNRLYAVESGCTVTGASGDHRFPVKPSEVENFARALYAAITDNGVTGATLPPSIPSSTLQAIADDLRQNRGKGLVIPGSEQPASVHALAHAINSAIGAVGASVIYTAPVEQRAENQVASLKALVDDMNGGNVDILAIVGGNPAYNAPADLKFTEAVLAKKGSTDKVPLRIRLGAYADETSRLCHWHVPESHALEAWGDARAFDGTASVVQPLIMPLYESKSAIEFVSELAGQPRTGYDLVRETWQSFYGTKPDFEKWWSVVLHDGVVKGTALPATSVALAANLESALPQSSGKGGMEIAFRPDPSLWDGRHANNSWLQELPKPITTLVWDNAAVISPATAKRLGIKPNDGLSEAENVARSSGKHVVTLDYKGRTLEMPVWIQPGQPDDVITVALGFGRPFAGNVGTMQGFNTYLLRTSDALGGGGGLNVQPTNKTYELAYTQPHHLMRGAEQTEVLGKKFIAEEHNRDIVRTASLEEYVKESGKVHAPGVTESEEAQEVGHQGGPQPGQEDTTADYYRQQWKYTPESKANKEGLPSLFPNYSYAGYNQWGMSIDLTTCIGCNACATACQAENNIPTVGKDQVGRGREMHWIRIDHYYEGEDLVNPESHFMPVACQHCEKAPCEPVCPVAATVHSHEGLNQMVYNRCVGTRYCSNNCPYKVRRYNFLKWTAGKGGPTTLNYFEFPVLQMAANPHVSIRGRGVMEKCTFCIQRINEGRIEAKKAGREIQDGDIITACQQVCPTGAIVFGDINNPNSQVSKLKAQPHDYSLLGDLNTRPRLTYLARIKNPNPRIAGTVGAVREAKAGA